VPLDDVLQEAIQLVAERYFDLCEESTTGSTRKVP